jgi:predicted enzyme related to lactoylglutathione lyase
MQAPQEARATLPINRIVLYAPDVEETLRFYEKHFGFEAAREAGDRIIELISLDGGANLMIHPAAKGQRGGQVMVKLVFDVADVEAFCSACAKGGLEFGAIHQADGYIYANAKDPCKNSISVSSRAFRKKGLKTFHARRQSVYMQDRSTGGRT